MNKEIKEAITALCLRESSYDRLAYDDTLEILDSFDWSQLNIEPSDFEEVYVFKAKGNYYLAHNFSNEKMFDGKKAIKLCESVDWFTGEAFCAANMSEIWLREDMRIEIVDCFRMNVDGSGGEYTVEYRYPTGTLSDEFDIVSFLDSLARLYGV